MTAPQSWALALPGAFPNVRGIVIDILSAGVMLDGRLLGPGHFAPASYPEAPLPFTEVYRNPSSAGVNPQGWEDIQELQLGMWVGSHRETYELVEEVRRVLRPFHHGGAHKGVWIDTIHEAGSPGAPSEEDEDRHEMVWPWLVVTRQHRGMAIYP